MKMTLEVTIYELELLGNAVMEEMLEAVLVEHNYAIMQELDRICDDLSIFACVTKEDGDLT